MPLTLFISSSTCFSISLLTLRASRSLVLKKFFCALRMRHTVSKKIPTIHYFLSFYLWSWRDSNSHERQTRFGLSEVRLPKFRHMTNIILKKVVCCHLHHGPIKNLYTIVAEAGLEPARSLLTRRFSYHSRFYTSQLIALPLVFYLETTDVYTVVPKIGTVTSCCGLDHFFTISVNFEVRN